MSKDSVATLLEERRFSELGDLGQLARVLMSAGEDECPILATTVCRGPEGPDGVRPIENIYLFLDAGNEILGFTFSPDYKYTGYGTLSLDEEDGDELSD